MIIAFDTETTGLDPKTSEIVTASIVKEESGISSVEWLLRTSIPSSDEAFEKHGITWETAKESGEDYLASIEDIASRLLAADYVVTANGVFDLTMLQASLDRYSEKEWDLSTVSLIDIMVLDKFIDKYRKGPRKLENLKQHYGVEYSGELHDATTDAVITFFVLFKLLPLLKQQGFDLPSLPQLCEREYLKQKKNLISYFRRVNIKTVVTLGYPVTTEEIKIG